MLAARAIFPIPTLTGDGFLTRLLAQLTHNRFRIIPGHLFNWVLATFEKGWVRAHHSHPLVLSHFVFSNLAVVP